MKFLLTVVCLWAYLHLLPVPCLARDLPYRVCSIFVRITDTAQNINGAQLSKRTLKSIRRKYSRLNKLIQQRTKKMLSGMESREFQLHARLYPKDSAQAQPIAGNDPDAYARYRKVLNDPLNGSAETKIKEYIPGLDSIKTAFRYLQGPAAQINGFSSSKLEQIRLAGSEIEQLQANIQHADEVRQFIASREQLLKGQFAGMGLGKELAGINNEAFYAQQQVAEFKEMLHDRQKAEQKVLKTLNEVPAFQQFMQKNSYLGQLFGLPDDYGSAQSLIGLQTRAQVQQLIGQFTGNSGGSAGSVDPSQYIQGQIGQARQQIDQLKSKLNLIGNSGGSGDVVMPEGKPNGEKTKTFLKRMVVGLNLQTQQSSNLMPALANLGLSAGYKIRPSLIAGIGASYRLGMGHGWNHIAFSSEGIGFRTYLDMRMKGSFWLSAGGEYNYLQSFRDLPDWRRPDLWQKSALIGITKKYKIKGKKESSIQLLFDALYKQHVPSTTPILFRTGFNF